MIESRRARLAGATKVNDSTNAGLWLDRFLPGQQISGEKVPVPPRPLHFREVVEIGAPAIYRQHFAARRAALELLGFDGWVVRSVRVRTTARLTTGLGAGSVLENGFSLHRTYGVPFLPASGLKGLAARTARERSGDAQWEKEGEFYQMLFGSTEEAGAVEWFDALPDPSQPFELVADVMTPHHGKYNGGEAVPPADWDAPKPVPFLSCSGTFELALFGPTDWVELAHQIMFKGLKSDGFGAKTSSGFGRMEEV